MLVKTAPDVQERIRLLGESASFDCDGETTPQTGERRDSKSRFLMHSIYTVRRANGPLKIMRTLQTSACERNCRYCAFRAGRDKAPRVKLSPDELARAFLQMERAGLVSGLFLSSAISGSAVRTMDTMLDTVKLLRTRFHYDGYVHLKIMPGAEQAQIQEAMRLANRVSVNLEGTNSSNLAFLAPQKRFDTELIPAMEYVHQISAGQTSSVSKPSLVTQFVVGPAGETDQDLLHTAARLYGQFGLSRAYYSRFNPVDGTPFSDMRATPPMREHRLYQADWLLRFYGFTAEELLFDPEGALPQNLDPKLAWARKNLSGRPVEVNRASRSYLLRVPGIGPRSADAIIRTRVQTTLRDPASLKKLGVVVTRALPYILLDGHQPPKQLSLWGEIPTS